jgi:hypothetical protein
VYTAHKKIVTNVSCSFFGMLNQLLQQVKHCALQIKEAFPGNGSVP